MTLNISLVQQFLTRGPWTSSVDIICDFLEMHFTNITSGILNQRLWSRTELPVLTMPGCLE